MSNCCYPAFDLISQERRLTRKFKKISWVFRRKNHITEIFQKLLFDQNVAKSLAKLSAEKPYWYLKYLWRNKRFNYKNLEMSRNVRTTKYETGTIGHSHSPSSKP